MQLMFPISSPMLVSNPLYMHIRNGLEAAHPAEQRGFRNHQGIVRNTLRGPSFGVSMADTFKHFDVLGCHIDGRPDHLSWILKKCDTHPVSQLWGHPGGRSFAVSQPHFSFSSWHTARLRIKFQNGSFYLSENNGKKITKRSANPNLNAHCHLQLVFLNIQC